MPFENVDIEQADSGWFRYFVGEETTIEGARNILAQVQAEGFQDAFITSAEKDFLVAADVSQARSENPTSYNATIPGATSVVKAKGSIERNLFEGNTVKSVKTYKVQFQSTRNLYTSKKDNMVFDDIEIREVNGWYRYYYGDATTIEEARELLKEVRAKGFKDAFVVVFINGELVNK